MPIVIKRSDGGVSILRLLEGKDALAEVEKWKTSAPGEYVSHREMDSEAIPEDRTFRNAWADVTAEPVIDHDMRKCRSIWRYRMRTARAPKLAALDIEAAKAIESGGDLKQISERKQALRDITKLPEIEAAKTPDELKSVWPESLN